MSLLSLNALSQDDDYTPYNKKRILCCYEGRHELLGSLNYTFDLDSKESTGGNIPPGMNYGFGLGYDYRISVDGYAQSLAIGVKAEWYPNSFFKFNTILEADLLGMRFGPISVFALTGVEHQIAFNPSFSLNEMHSILSMAEINIYRFELKWGLQSDFELFKEASFLDDTFNVYKLTYRHYL